MSKPKPGLGKGIARTLAHSHSVPTAPTAAIHPPVPLAPVFSTPSRSLHLSSLPRPSPWTPAAVQTHLALLPLWDAPEFGRRTYVTATSPLRASTVEVTSAGTFVPPYHPTSLLSVSDRPQVFFNEFYNVPPPPPPPPAMVLRPSPPHPAAAPQQPRTSQAAHTIISPSPQPQNGPSPSPSPPITFLGIRPDEVDFQNAASIPDPNNLSVYSSNLIFHLGASGCPKERSPTPPRRKQAATTPPPPRPRSFPLPDVTPPTNLQSTAVGEDSYFARVDGVCVADGVGGWSRSGKGADPGRWSRLLTHFCEEEVARWWAGADEYIATDEEVSGWAARAWKRGSEGGRHRRPLDPVEIMQKGFEKCLACAASEGIYGSSTCLLALLHHSTLLVANVGDCSLLLIRRGEVVFRTSEMQHAFNFPMQLGTHSRDEPMKDAKRYDIPVEKEDVVIVGSDGLMDNLFDEDILETLSEFAPPEGSSPASTLPPFSPQLVSEALRDRARLVSEQMTATTPFMVRAIEEGIDFVGGKKDDISVLVGVIGDRDGLNLTLDASAR